MSVTTTNGTGAGEVAISDTLLAAWLWTQGLRPMRVTGQAPRKSFVFTDVPEGLIAAFHLDTATVSPMQFGQAYKALLRLIHQ